LPMQERAAVLDTLLPARNVGMVFSTSAPEQRVTFAGGVFNNWLDKDQPEFSDNGSQIVSRITWAPIDLKEQDTLLHLGAGYRYSSGGEAGLLALGPEFNKSPEFSQTVTFEPSDLHTYSAEASLRSGPFWLHSEMALMDVDDSIQGNQKPFGYSVTASWILTGETREYNYRSGIFKGIQIARSVDQNGWGAVEAGVRFSHADLSDFRDAVGGNAGDIDIWSLGLNWWPSSYLNMNINYRYVSFDRLGMEGDSHGINSRIMIILE
jgi:phosphate-selective porin OprO/OprP